MIINIFLGLLGVGLISALYQGMRFQKILTLLFLAVIGVLFADFYSHWQMSFTDSYSYPWLTSRYYPVNLDFASNLKLYQLILPFFILAILSVVSVIVDEHETQKLYICSIIAFSLAFLIMLVTSQNTIQLLVSTCFIDVLGFYLINSVSARRQYIFYNLLADMGLFMLFAMFWGNCETNLLRSLPRCIRHHDNFVLWILILSPLIKVGLFPFQGYFLQLSELSNTRRNILSFLSTPISGFFILYKTYDLIPETRIFWNFIEYAAYGSIIWGFICSIIIKDLSSKKLYLNLMFYGLVFAILGSGTKDFGSSLCILLLLQYLLISSLEYSYHRFFVLFITVIVILEGIITSALFLVPDYASKLYLGGMMLSLVILLPQLKHEHKTTINYPLLSLNLCLAIYMYFKYQPISHTSYYIIGVYLLLFLFLKPLQKISSLYNLDTLQSADYFSQLYHSLLVAPIQFLGRVLWLTIDFLIIERTLLNSLTRVNKALTRGIAYLHHHDVVNMVIYLLLGFSIIIGCFYIGK